MIKRQVMHQIIGESRLKKLPISMNTLLCAVPMLGAVLLLTVPFWQTNDDIAMSMMVHGYGIINHGSANLIFSNTLWGYLIDGLPTFGWLRGYTIVTYSLLLLITWFFIHAFVRHTYSLVSAVGITLALMALPLISPQFTVTAGLLALVAVLSLRQYAQSMNPVDLGLGLTAFFVGFLIRDQMCVLTALVAAPLLTRQSLRRHLVLLSLLALFVACCLAWWFDQKAYTSSAWQLFQQLRYIRVPFIDYQAVAFLIAHHADALEDMGYSANDLKLIREWFFVDRNIYNATGLSHLLALVPKSMSVVENLALIPKSFKLLLKLELLVLLIGALGLSIEARRQKNRAMTTVIAVAALFVLAIMAMAMLGRPGILRVYYPLVAVLFVSAVVTVPKPVAASSRPIFIIIMCVAVCNVALMIVKNRHLEADMTRLHAQIDSVRTGFEGRPVAVWGSALPYELLFPVNRAPLLDGVTFYPLNSFTQVPGSVATQIEKNPLDGFIARLKSAEGVNLIAKRKQLDLLETYCSERLSGILHAQIITQSSLMSMYRIACY